MKSVLIKDHVIGEGIPKICVSLTSITQAGYEKELATMEDQRIDMIEWRIDHMRDALSLEAVVEVGQWLHAQSGNRVLLATFRSREEGGETEVDKAYYQAMYMALIDAHCVDMIDLEYHNETKLLKDTIVYAQEHNVPVLLSTHNFDHTPTLDEMVEDMCEMQGLGSDLVKLAVMPQNKQDMLLLLLASLVMREYYAQVPIITIAMGKLGTLSRVSGEVFGSAITFASVMQESAPGQIPVEDAKVIMETLHKYI